jgi:Uncharacterized protein conserved in bacteria
VPAVPVSGTEPTTVTPKAVERTRMGAAVAPAVPPQKKRSAWPFVLALVALLAVLAGLGYLLADQLQGDGGGATVTVDDYVGLTLDKATLLIERAGLEADPTLEINDRVPENEVFKQEPPKGTKVKEGDKVELTVSQGRERWPYLTSPASRSRMLRRSWRRPGSRLTSAKRRATQWRRAR